jgi:hypothetical protein
VQNLNDGLGSSSVNDCCNVCTVFLEDLQAFWVFWETSEEEFVVLFVSVVNYIFKHLNDEVGGDELTAVNELMNF